MNSGEISSSHIQTLPRSSALRSSYGASVFLQIKWLLVSASMVGASPSKTPSAQSRAVGSAMPPSLVPVPTQVAISPTTKSKTSLKRTRVSKFTMTKKLLSSTFLGTRINGSLMTIRRPLSRRSSGRTRLECLAHSFGHRTWVCVASSDLGLMSRVY